MYRYKLVWPPPILPPPDTKTSNTLQNPARRKLNAARRDGHGLSHIYMMHVTHMNEARHTSDQRKKNGARRDGHGLSYIRKKHVSTYRTYMDKTRHTYDCMAHEKKIDRFFFKKKISGKKFLATWWSRPVTHMDEAFHAYGCGMPRIGLYGSHKKKRSEATVLTYHIYR